ncbi:MAG: hypothetical protein WC473_00725 [Patescibacteria group bacterium]|jgi:hypothetical protein
MSLEKNKVINQLIYWLPRILGLLFVGFLALFSLDIFSMGLRFWPTVLGLLIHNIPALILLAIIIVSWKYEIVGGIVFVLFGLTYIAMVLNNPFEWYMLFWMLEISGGAFLVGILFLVNWRRRKRQKLIND